MHRRSIGNGSGQINGRCIYPTRMRGRNSPAIGYEIPPVRRIEAKGVLNNKRADIFTRRYDTVSRRPRSLELRNPDF